MPKTGLSTPPPHRILVVDDEPFVCDALKMLLEFDGHKVQTAHNAPDALAMYEPGKFDLVITDYSMPQMKGDELAVAIKERVPAQPVVMVTAYAEMLKLPIKGVDFVISKPFPLESLREAIFKTSKIIPGPAENKQNPKE
jgi:two-component system cell cycle sensor histidine kinase/response regulator CckA